MSLGPWFGRLIQPVAGPLPLPDPAQVSTLAARLEAAGRRRAGRATTLLHVGTGGCGGCALEIGALNGPAIDIGRAGLRFVETPLHADILLVTGLASRNATGPLRRAWEAMAEPHYVIAVGDCGNDAADTYALAAGGIAGVVPIDLVVRGSPPPPDAILLGVLTLVEAARRS